MKDLVGGICTTCGRAHDANTRRRDIWRMVHDGLSAADIREAWPCWYPRTEAGERMLYRDMAYCREATLAEVKLWAGFADAQRELDELRAAHN